MDLPVPWERCESRLGAACFWVWILQTNPRRCLSRSCQHNLVNGCKWALHIKESCFFGDFLRILQILHGAQNGAEFWHRAFKEHPAACGLKGPPADRAPRARPYRGSLQVGFMWASPLRPLWMLADVQYEI